MESRMIHTGPDKLERLFSLIDSNFCAMIDKKKRMLIADWSIFDSVDMHKCNLQQ